MRLTYTHTAQGNFQTLEEMNGEGLLTNRLTPTNNAWNQVTQVVRTLYGATGNATGTVTTAMAYDSNGNHRSESIGGVVQRTNTWSQDNRLTSVSGPSGFAGSYAYDANGLRTSKTEGGVATRYVLDGANVLEELNSSGTTTASYLNHPDVIDEQLAVTIGGTTYWPLTDALGSVYALTDSSGSVTRSYGYDAYGARSTSGAGPELAYGFTGREHDGSGMRYHRDRYADSTFGRWSQPDRAGFRDGPNLYAYVVARPTSLVDPLGLSYEERMLLLAHYSSFLEEGTRAGRREDLPGWQVDFLAALTGLGLAVGVLKERVHPCGEQAADLLGYLSVRMTFTDYKLFPKIIEGWDPYPGVAHQWVYIYSYKDREQLILDPFLGTAWSAQFHGVVAYDDPDEVGLTERPVLPQTGDAYWQRIFVK